MVANVARSELDELVATLPEEDVPAVVRYLRFLRSGQSDPVKWALDNAPPEDEPTSAEEDAGREEAWQEYLRGETLSADDAKRLLLP